MLTARNDNAKKFVSSVLFTLVIGSGVDGAKKIDVSIKPTEANSLTIKIIGQDVFQILSMLSKSSPAILNKKSVEQLKKQEQQPVDASSTVGNEKTPLIPT